MSGFTPDTFIGLTALISGFGIYYLDLRKKISEILENREGILTQTQAEHLLELNLDAIHHHMIVVLRHYIANDYLKDRETGDINIIMGSVGAAYESVVKDNKRQMVSSFELRGHKTFESLLNAADNRVLKATFSKAQGLFLNAINTKQDPDITCHLLESVLLEGKSLGRALLAPMIANAYRRRS